MIILDKKLSHHNWPISEGIPEERRYSFVYTIHFSVQSLNQLSGELNARFNGLVKLHSCASSWCSTAREGLSYRWLATELFDGNDELPKIAGVLEDKCDMKNSDIVLRVRSLDECAFGRT